jgi:hypothetical protein
MQHGLLGISQLVVASVEESGSPGVWNFEINELACGAI